MSTRSAWAGNIGSKFSYRADVVRREFHDFYNLVINRGRDSSRPDGKEVRLRPHRQHERRRAQLHGPPDAVPVPLELADGGRQLAVVAHARQLRRREPRAAPSRTAQTPTRSTSSASGTSRTARWRRTSGTAYASSRRPTSRSSRRRWATSTSASSRATTRAPRTAPSARSALDVYVTNPGYQTRPTTVHVLLHGARRVPDGRHQADGPLSHVDAPSLQHGRDLHPAAGPQRLQRPGAHRRGRDGPDGRLAGTGNKFQPFNPFTTTPVQRPFQDKTVTTANWDFGPNFGKARNNPDYQQPRTFLVVGGRPLLGFRFSFLPSGAGLRPGSFFSSGWYPRPMRTGRLRDRRPALSLVLASRGMPPRPRRRDVPRRRRVILVSVDTLRSDHLPGYGYTGVETPALDALRKDSILFEHAWSHVPLTLPVARLDPDRPRAVRPRHPRQPRLSPQGGGPDPRRAPQEAGYETGGRRFVLRPEGARAGSRAASTSTTTPSSRRRARRPSAASSAPDPRPRPASRSWLAARPASGQLFAFLHLYEPHTPYEPPEPFKTRYAAQPLRRRDRGGGRDRRKVRRLPEGARPLRPGPDRLPLGPRRGARRPRRVRARDVPLPRGAPGAALREAPRRQARRRDRCGAGGARRRLHDARGGRGRAGIQAARGDAVPARSARRPARAASSRRRSSRGSTSAGAISPRSTTAAGTTSTPRRRRSTTSPPTPARPRTVSPRSRTPSARCSSRPAERKPAFESAGDLDPESRKKLTSLGYLSAGPVERERGSSRRPEGPHPHVRGAAHGPR